MLQLIYTSAPRLLEAGKTGFGTVARSRRLPQALVAYLERISTYDRAASVASFMFYSVFRMGRMLYHVFSRVSDCGVDYTRRTNHIAHHWVMSEEEAESEEIRRSTPAGILLSVAGHWRNSWQDNPAWLEDELAPHPLCGNGCGTWLKYSGTEQNALWLSAQSFRDGGYVSLPPSCTDEEALQLLHEAMQLRNDHGWGLGFTTAAVETLSSKVCPLVCLAPAQIAAGKQPRNGSAHVKVEPGMQPPSPAELPSAPVPPAQFMPPEGTELHGVPGQPSMVEYTMIQSPAPRQQLANPLPMNAVDMLPAGPPQSVGMPRPLPTAEGYFRSTPKPARPAVVKMTSEKSSGRYGLQLVLILSLLGLIGWLGWCYYQKSQETAVKSPPVSKKCSQPEKKVKPAEPTLNSKDEAKTSDNRQETPGGETGDSTPGGGAGPKDDKPAVPPVESTGGSEANKDGSDNPQEQTGGETGASTTGGDAAPKGDKSAVPPVESTGGSEANKDGSDNPREQTGGETGASTTGGADAPKGGKTAEPSAGSTDGSTAKKDDEFTLMCSDLEDVKVEAEIGDQDVKVTVTPTIRLVDVWSACPDQKNVMYLYIDDKEYTEEDKDKDKRIQLRPKKQKGLPIPDEVKQALEEVNAAQREYEAAQREYEDAKSDYKTKYKTKVQDYYEKICKPSKNNRITNLERQKKAIKNALKNNPEELQKIETELKKLWDDVDSANKKKNTLEETLKGKRSTAERTERKLKKEYKEKFSIKFTLGERKNVTQHLKYEIIYNGKEDSASEKNEI